MTERHDDWTIMIATIRAIIATIRNRQPNRHTNRHKQDRMTNLLNRSSKKDNYDRLLFTSTRE